MIDLSKHRIVDLSKMLYPGSLKVNGEYLHGRETRRLEIRQFTYAQDKMLMHWVETETHIGTHVEGPSHYKNTLETISEIPLEIFIAEAVVLNLTALKPLGGKAQPITATHLRNVKRGDIVLMWSPYNGDEAPYISPEAAQWLKEKGIKMIGVQGIQVEASGSVVSHVTFLGNGIPIIEGLENLNELRRDRVFYIGFPMKIAGIDSSWIRAVALEPL